MASLVAGVTILVAPATALLAGATTLFTCMSALVAGIGKPVACVTALLAIAATVVTSVTAQPGGIAPLATRWIPYSTEGAAHQRLWAMDSRRQEAVLLGKPGGPWPDCAAPTILVRVRVK